MIDTNTYVSIVIGAILVEFTTGIIALQIKENLSKIKKLRFIYWEFISYGLIAIITTALYKIEQFKAFCNSFIISAYYVNESLLKKWYNFFVPWLNNNEVIQNSFFQAVSLKMVYFIIIGITLIACLFLLVVVIVDGLDIFDVIFVLIIFAMLAITPITCFYSVNVIFICTNNSETLTWIVMIIIQVILSLVFGIGFNLYKRENEKCEEQLEFKIDTEEKSIKKKISMNKFPENSSNSTYEDLLAEYAGETLEKR